MNALLFIEGFHCKGEGEVRPFVFAGLWRTRKAEDGIKTLETNAERPVLFQLISSYDQSVH